MSTYYKATRPDGTDFYTGSVNYAEALASGEVLRHSETKKRRDDPQTYFSVSVEPADCTGFSWPCRLFRVEPVGQVMGSRRNPLQASPHKRAVSALRVVEELPAWMALGPNGEAVAALIERAARLTADEAKALTAAWAAARDTARDTARDAARAAAWAAARDTARDAAWGAAGDAALALVVRDRISQEHFDALYGPWASVTEDPR